MLADDRSQLCQLRPPRSKPFYAGKLASLLHANSSRRCMPTHHKATAPCRTSGSLPSSASPTKCDPQTDRVILFICRPWTQRSYVMANRLLRHYLNRVIGTLPQYATPTYRYIQ